MDLAGEVVGVGRQVTLFAPGDRIMAVVGGGAQATLARVDESHALAVPDDISWPEAGGFPEVFTTAYDALFTQAGLKMGERVLVSGAAGGVGTAGVQLAAGGGSDRHGHRARRVAPRRRGGAGRVDGARARTTRATAAPYDVVLELVGAPSLEAVLPHLATGARVVVIGVGGGAQVDLNLFSLMGTRARIGGSTLRGRTRSEKADVAAAMAAHVVPALATGRIRVPVCETFPLSEAQAAYDRFAEGAKLGKVVLVDATD